MCRWIRSVDLSICSLRLVGLGERAEWELEGFKALLRVDRKALWADVDSPFLVDGKALLSKRGNSYLLRANPHPHSNPSAERHNMNSHSI